MASKGVIVWRGDKGKPRGHYSKTTIGSVTDDAALNTLITALASHTDCNSAKRSFLSNTGMTDALPGANVNVDKKGIVYFRHPTTLKVHSVTLPGITAASTELVDEGERMTPAAVAAIVTAINTATGIAYSPLYGVVEQPR